MPEKSTQQQILDQVSSLTIALATHIAKQSETDGMTKAMYKILITGNGVPPLPEVVRQHSEWIKSRAIIVEEIDQMKEIIRKHDEWIQDRECEISEDKIEKKSDKAISRADAKTDRYEATEFRHQIWLVAGVQICGFIILGIEIALHMK